MWASGRIHSPENVGSSPTPPLCFTHYARSMNKTTIISTPQEPNQTQRLDPADAQSIEPGDWYWFKHEDDGETIESLCCVFHVGSNYALIKHPQEDWTQHWRVHFNDWDTVCRYESSPQTWFEQWANNHKQAITRINQEIHDICTRLGVDPTGKRLPSNAGNSNLAVVSSAADTGQYKNALIAAKDTELPALFKKIKEHGGQLKRWLLASSMSIKARCGDMDSTVSVINDRIFAVSVYAGLTENVTLIQEGEPAHIGEKLRIMQGKLFMDEECLLNYSHGGIDFDRIEEFDQWLCRPENAARILPFARCMVAFQVRRYKKDRQSNSLSSAWINIQLARQDELTFLYVRNGERIYRLDTDIEFGNELFADLDEFNFDEPMMVNNKEEEHPTMPLREYEERVAQHNLAKIAWQAEVKEYRRQNALFKRWRKKNRKAKEEESGFDYKFRRPWEPGFDCNGFYPEQWSPLDDSNVYLDDVNIRIRKQANYYNRISTLIQGLLDRSETLHPHPPYKLWTPQGFEAFIELVYDHDRTLYDGPQPPSWEEYKAQCNANIRVGSIVIGQYEVWRESLPRVRERGDYYSIPYRYTEGNPGPGHTVQEWSPRSKKATFRWKQVRWIHRSRYGERSGDTEYDRSISVPVDKLFNISGYTPGDYKQFFNDPRTRRQYHKWAHLLLTAEEFYAGNLDPETLEKPRKS